MTAATGGLWQPADHSVSPSRRALDPQRKRKLRGWQVQMFREHGFFTAGAETTPCAALGHQDAAGTTDETAPVAWIASTGRMQFTTTLRQFTRPQAKDNLLLRDPLSCSLQHVATDGHGCASGSNPLRMTQLQTSAQQYQCPRYECHSDITASGATRHQRGIIYGSRYIGIFAGR